MHASQMKIFIKPGGCADVAFVHRGRQNQHKRKYLCRCFKTGVTILFERYGGPLVL